METKYVWSEGKGLVFDRLELRIRVVVRTIYASDQSPNVPVEFGTLRGGRKPVWISAKYWCERYLMKYLE